MRNLFIDLHECRVGDEDRRFGTGWEDLFTDQLAFYLACDPAAAAAVAAALLGEEEAEVTSVEAQPSGDDGRPDLALRRPEGPDLLVEHKFDAPLHGGQLRRYLRRGVVALVSRRNLTVSDEVARDENYLRPSRGEHFRWEQVFDALPLPGDPPEAHETLRETFRSYMRELGLAPSGLGDQWRRLFEDRTVEENQRVQKEFGRWLNGVATHLREEWELEVQDVSHKGKQAWAPPEEPWNHLYVYPRRLPSETVPGPLRGRYEPGYEALAVEVVFEEKDVDAAEALLGRLPGGFEDPDGIAWDRIGQSPISRARVRVTVATPLPPLLEAGGDREREEQVHRGAVAAVDRVLGLL